MWRFIKSLFAWQLVRDTGAIRYYQNAVSGKRRAVVVVTGYAPIDRRWLDGFEFTSATTPPIGGTSGVRLS